MPAGVRRDHPVSRREGRDLVIPHAVVQEAAVQQDQRVASAAVVVGKTAVFAVKPGHVGYHDN